MKKIIKHSLKLFRIILLSVTIILTIISLIIFLSILCSSFVLKFQYDINGVVNFLALFNPFKEILTATFITIPIYIGLETLITNLNSQEGKAILDFRILLTSNDNIEIHNKTRGANAEWSVAIPNEELNDINTWRKIDNYLGTLELLNILIDKDLISIDSFNNQFGYRVDNIYYNVPIKEYIDNYPTNTWSELHKLFNKRQY